MRLSWAKKGNAGAAAPVGVLVVVVLPSAVCLVVAVVPLVVGAGAEGRLLNILSTAARPPSAHMRKGVGMVLAAAVALALLLLLLMPVLPLSVPVSF